MKNDFIEKMITRAMIRKEFEKGLTKDIRKKYTSNTKNYINNNSEKILNLCKKLVKVKIEKNILTISKKQLQKIYDNTKIIENENVKNYTLLNQKLTNQKNFNKSRFLDLCNINNTFIYNKYSKLLDNEYIAKKTKDKKAIEKAKSDLLDFRQKYLQKQKSYSLSNKSCKKLKLLNKELKHNTLLKLRIKSKKRKINTYSKEKTIYFFDNKINQKNNIKHKIKTMKNTYLINIENCEFYIQNTFLLLLENKSKIFINKKNQLFIPKSIMYKLFRNIDNMQYSILTKNKKEKSIDNNTTYYNKFVSINNDRKKVKNTLIKKVLKNIKFSNNEKKIIELILKNDNYNFYKALQVLNIPSKNTTKYKNRISQKIINYCTSNKITLNNLLIFEKA